MVFIVLLFILDVIVEKILKLGIFIFVYILYLCIILYYYSIIKSILGIKLFLKNIIQKNISVVSKKILFLFIPSLLLTMYIILFSIHYIPAFLMGLVRITESVILIIGCFSLLCYYLLNKTLLIKTSNKIMLAIIQPIIYFMGYFVIWIFIIG